MSDERPDLHAQLRDVPHKPGVYVMRDRLNRIIYVGKARDLRKRLSSYFTPSRRTAADIKTRALIDSTWNFDIHIVKSEAEAVLYEGKLIKDFRPKYNVSFRDDKRFLLVRVDLNEPWPRFHPTRLRRDDGARYFGPFADSRALRTSLEAMHKMFGVRTCRATQPDEKDFRHCLDHVIKNCTAPCVGKISREDYLVRVENACRFLEGESRHVVERVEAAMHAAAEKLDFEKATTLRNLLKDLRTTTKPMTRFKHKSLPSPIDPAADLADLAEALNLPAPPAVMECFDVANISNTHIVASMVRFRNGVPDRENYRRYRIVGVETQNDFASMAEVVRRRYARLARETSELLGEDSDVTQESALEAIRRLASEKKILFPDLVIVDGGRGQLNAACAELQRLGLSEIPIIGLAEQFEEIYTPDYEHPLRLDHRDGALQLLQRIRDEAHRFANSYHSLLLKRRMKESILDDIPGLSATRKSALLKKFGSVARLRHQTAEVLAETPGISLRIANEVLAVLAKNKDIVDSKVSR